ncbi:MAG: hypothetical protein WC640_00715 [Candidatus Paceibacterota bacterium]|jgi:hypothetical protein
MNQLNSQLAHYQKLLKDKQSEIGLIAETVKKQTNLTIMAEEIRLKEGILFLKTKSKHKLEVILKKRGILDQLKELGVKVFDLR